MKSTKISGAALVATLVCSPLLACTNGQGDVDVTATNVATFPAPPDAVLGQAASVDDATTDGAVTLDLGSELSSLGGIGTLSAALSKNTVSGEGLAYVHHISATVAAADGKLPVTLATDVDVPAGSSAVDLPLSMTDARLLDYLSEGKVVVHFYLTGAIPDRGFTLTHTLVAHVNVAVSRSVVKF